MVFYQMLRRYWILGAVLAAEQLAGGRLRLCACAAACRTPKPRLPGSRSASRRTTRRERLARAHAHYAAGVVHEMDGDSAAADEEYYQAALLDPDDETLVLEVSRRLLQNKQPQKALEVVARAAARPDASGRALCAAGAGLCATR